MAVVIRRGERGDERAIARVHVRSWQETYRGAFPDRFLDGLDPAQRVPMWERTLADATLTTFVAEVDGEVVGFVLVGPSRDRPGGEVMAIYLLPESWRTGLGRRLMAAAEEALVEAGHDEAYLWVLDSNDRAQEFYRAVGWTATGEEKSEQVFGLDARELLYRKLL